MAAVMQRKGYYNELVGLFEDIRGTRNQMDREVEAMVAERLDLEGRITVLKARLAALDESLPANTAMRDSYDVVIEMREEDWLERRTTYVSRRREAYRAAVLAPGEEASRRSSESGPVEVIVPLEDLSFASADGHQVAARRYGPVIRIPRPARGTGEEVAVQEPAEAAPEPPPAGAEAEAAPGQSEAEAQAEAEAVVQEVEPGPVPPAVLLYFHGEGYVAGDLETHDWLCRTLASLSGAVLVLVDYRRPPESTFPAAFEDAYAAVQWAAGGGLGLEYSALGVGGDSCGAALALACCLRARDEEGGPSIDFQVLLHPWLDLRPDSPSMQAAAEEGELTFLDDAWMTRLTYAPPRGAYKGAGQWFEDPRVSPLLAESLADLPCAFVAYRVDGLLSGDAQQFHERLQAEVGDEAFQVLAMEHPAGSGWLTPAGREQALEALNGAAAFVREVVLQVTSPPEEEGEEEEEGGEEEGGEWAEEAAEGEEEAAEAEQ